MDERLPEGRDLPQAAQDAPERGHLEAVERWLRQHATDPSAPLEALQWLRGELSAQTRKAQQRRDTEEAEHARAQQRALFDAAPIFLCVLGVDGRIRDLNQQALALLGAGALGGLLASHADAADEGHLVRLLRRALSGDTAQGRCVLQGATGARPVLALQVAPVWHAGAVAQLVVAGRDVSAEAELLVARAEMQAVKAANDAKSRFLSRVSHELRTPLNSLLGFAELIRNDVASHDVRTLHRLDQIELAGSRLQQLLDQTLDLSRLEIGAVNLQMQAVPLALLVARCTEQLQGEALARSVRLVCEGAAADCLVHADPIRLSQVLETLLAVAIRRSPAGSPVQVSVQPEGSGVQLRVTDAGVALDAESLQAIFSPLEQTLAQTVTGESNMRLTIARQLCGLMAGSLAAEAGDTGGLAFRCWLPRATSQLAPEPPAPPRPPVRRCKVLYVEDVESNVELLRQVLAGTQWDLSVATTGLEGVEKAKLERPDLLLLDLNLPDIDGVEVRRRLLQDPATARIPCAALTADVVGRQQSPPDVPFDAWLAKPLRIKLLREAMARLVTPA